MYNIYEQLRNDRKLKDADVVRATGIGQGVFSDWKKGRYTPKTDKLQKIADFFGVSLENLTTGKDSAKESIDGTKYYFDDDTARKAQELFENKDMRILFDAARGAKAEDLQMAADILMRLKEGANE